jgi:DNA-binding transcriptional MocR family regulator
MHLCIRLDGILDRKIADRAARTGLWLVPLSSSYAGGAARQGFILGFGNIAASEMPNAVRKLRDAIWT